MALPRSMILATAAASALAIPAGAPKVILAVIVDDLGWHDVGFHGSTEIPTPAMDGLVKEGIELTRHYVYKMCTPSRSSFFSGRLPVHVQQNLDNPEVQHAGVPRNMTAIGQKLQQAGYHTAVVGKWDIGMATPTHTPSGRGFNESLIYYEHKNDYWTQTLAQSNCTTYNPIVDLWSNDGPAVGLNGTQYEEYLFRDRVVDIINRAVDNGQPLALVWTPHVAHCPLMVPKEQLAKFNLTDDEAYCHVGDSIDNTPYIFPGNTLADFRCRSQYSAMVNLLDDEIANVTSLLKSKGLWDDTLMILSSDNGGPLVVSESGANNYPLRGGKYSDFEGGIRATAFVSGGYLPPQVRGTTLDGVIAIADWYGTFAKLAGVDPSDPVAKAAGLPPVDSVDLWPYLSGQVSTSPRTELPVSTQTLIQGQYKYITGKMQFASWQGEIYPNASSAAHAEGSAVLDCTSGCLFDVVSDLTEHTNIAPSNPSVVASMAKRLAELSKGFYSNSDVGVDDCPPGIGMLCACYDAMHKWGGFFGPYQY